MTYDLVIIGATTTALGLAQTVQGRLKTLIVNATEMVAYDCINCFKMPGVYTQAAAYNHRFRELQADVLLGTDVVSITAREGGYSLELLDAGGYRTIEAKQLVDTTLEREGELTGKSLNAIIIQQQGKPLPVLQWEGFTLVGEEHEELYRTAILKLDCEREQSVAEARHRLVQLWLRRPEALKEWKIAAIAFCFEERTSTSPAMKDERYALLPAAAYADAESSMAAGIEWGGRLVS